MKTPKSILFNFLRFVPVFLAISLPYAQADLPDLGAPGLKTYNAQTEKALGRAFTTELFTNYALIQDPETLSYLRRVGDRIVSHTGRARDFSFYLINNPEINAFAGPDGVIGVNTGLINAVKTEDELASVIAHEVAHITQNHLSRSFEYQKGTSITNIAGIIAAILIGSQDPNAGMATYLSSMGLNIQNELKNSRTHEHEADYIGIKYLHKSGYDPHAMGDFFGRLALASQNNEFKTPEILLTHPVTEKRLAQAEERAQTYPPFNHAQDTSKTLRLIQIRLKFITHQRENSPKDLAPLEKCYLQLLQSDDKPTPPVVLSTCDSAELGRPPNRVFRLAQLQSSHQSLPKTLQNYDALRAYYPSDFSILYREAEYLQHNKKITQAIHLLLERTETYSSKYLLYSKLAELYALKKQMLRSDFYYAKANFHIGNLQKTKYLLSQIVKSPTLKKEKFMHQVHTLLNTTIIMLKNNKILNK